MAFYVGQKVVCVDDDTCEIDNRQRLFLGRVYTVRSVRSTPGAIYAHHPNYVDEKTFLALKEITDRVGCDTAYAASRFRPVVERKTDIGIFQAMLNPSREQVPA